MIAALSVAGLAVRRGERRLFEGLSLHLAAGEALALTGPNGSGKTSLIRAIAGLVRPEAGEIGFNGAAGPLDAHDARAEGLHLVGHQDGLSGARTAGEELAFQTGWTGGQGMATAIDTLDLGPLLKLEVRRLSAGQRRRLALARLIASPRPLWLLDEPLSPLDGAWRARFGALMAAHVAGGGLLIAAVHDPLPLAARNLDLAA